MNRTAEPLPDFATTREQIRECKAAAKLLEAQFHLDALRRAAKRVRESSDSWYWSDPVQAAYFGGADTPGTRRVAPVDFAWFRQYGMNWPFWRTWLEHARYRAAGRTLWTLSPLAFGALGGLCAYVIGEGFVFRAVARKDVDAPEILIDAVQQVIDEFIEVNEFNELQQELFIRDRRDGEFFLRYWREDDEPLQLRVLEPAEIIEPPNCDPWTDSFGVLNPRQDIYGRLGYYWAPDGDATHGEVVPAADMDHSRVNVDRHVKRGLTDFFAGTHDTISTAGAMIENMVQAGKTQAAIAQIVQHATATPSQVASYVQALATYNTAANFSGIPTSTQNYTPGMRLDIDKGQEYIVPPFTQNTPGFVQVVQQSLRTVGVKWNAPEWLTSGDASNNNYASSITAESPFVKRSKQVQAFYKTRFKRAVVRAVKHACACGMVIAAGRQWTWDDLKLFVDIEVEAPTVETRNRLQEAQTDQINIMNGTDSRQQAAQRQGRDWKRVESDNQEYEDAHGMQGQPLGVDDGQGDEETNLSQKSQSQKGDQLSEGWVTIGSKSGKGEDEERGGSHVYIGSGGKIEKGPSKLIGKKPSDLKSKPQTDSTSKSASPKDQAQQKSPKSVSLSSSHLRSIKPDYSKVKDSKDREQIERGVKAYYDGDFTAMNTSLREGKDASPEIKDKIEGFRKAFDKVGHELKNDTLVYRYVKKLPFDVSKVGTIFQDNGFVSTTADKNIAHTLGSGGDTSERKIFTIKVPTGTKVVSGMGGEDPSKEVTLPEGCKFKVVSVGKKKLLGQQITLEVVR